MPDLRRRQFITLLGGAAGAWPLAARAQQSERVRHLAAMMGGRNADTDAEGRALFTAFRQGLQELGWVEGRNLRADYRWPAGEPARMRVIAKDFVEAKPDVLFAGSTPGVLALLAETRTIPIVFTNLNDPVGTGAVASFARPGGNATGFTAFEYSLAGKWLEMLKEVAPAARRIALIFNPETAPYAHHYLTFIQAAAPVGVTANAVSVGSVAEMEAAVEGHARAAGGALVALPDGFILNNRASLIALAARLRLPAIYSSRKCRRGRPVVLWTGNGRPLSSLGIICRPRAQGREAGRPTCPTADQVRTRHQHEDHQGARTRSPRHVTRPSGRGDRMT
jgi:ABC transporter substrate binding protein